MKKLLLSVGAVLGLFISAQGQNAPSNAPLPPPFEWGPGIKVLIMGGGWAHDYNTWFNKADTATLNKAGIASVHYTEETAVVNRELKHADVFILSCNKVYPGFITPQFRQSISNYIDSGKGLIVLHSGVWWNWHWGDKMSEWNEFNQELVGCGTFNHDGLAPFDETIIKDHPVTHGLPQTFKITDELYHPEPTNGCSPMEVLAEASRPGGQKYPSVWLVHYHKARIVCIALGHDGNSHNAPEFQKLLVNAVKWTSGH